MGDRKSLTLAEGMVGMSENVFINIKNRPITLTADVEIPAGKTANGILIAQGGRFGGWALYVKDGIVAYDYNFLGMSSLYGCINFKTYIRANIQLSLILLTMEVDSAKGGLGTLYIDGKKVGEGRIERTQPGIFSADETADVGIDLATPVVERIGAEAKSKFNGRIPKLVVEVK